MATTLTANFKYLLENIDSEAPGDLAVAPGQTEATLFFVLDFARAVLIADEIIGYTTYDDRVFNPGAAVPIVGGLKRTIPMSHPGYPYLYASSVEFQPLAPDGKWKSDDIVWAKAFFSDLAPQTSVEWKTMPYTAKYVKVRMKVTFTTRNYLLLTDTQLDEVKLGDGVAPKQYSFWIKRQRIKPNRELEVFQDISFYDDFREYLRYTTMEIEPSNELVVQEKGGVYYKRDPNLANLPILRNNNSVLSAANASATFQNITKNKVRIKWHQIPKYSLTYPLFTAFAGQCNYGPNFDDDAGNVAVWNYEFFNFAPGTLLFLGMTSEPSRQGVFIRPMSKETSWKLFFPQLTNNFVDITFEFMQFVIPPDQLFLPRLRTMQPNRNGKAYSNGWNFAPFSDRMFRYVESTSDGFNPLWPTYWSAPFQMLFNANPLTPLDPNIA